MAKHGAHVPGFKSPMTAVRLFALSLVATLMAVAAAEAAPKSRGGFKHEPMIFFVAKGGADACGPGCDTWIAAEGTFDPNVHERLSAFLKAPERRKLPIFFHSPGGELQPSIATGNVLRERRMTAGIGQTIPDGCRERPRADAACRKLMASGRVMTAKLKVESGICASGCGYALIGASVRLVGDGAKLGVHASRLVPIRFTNRRDRRASAAMARDAERQSYDLLKQYVALAGVDPALIDLARTTPHSRVHWLSRDELNRFGIVPGDYFETEWLRIPVEDGKFTIVKSLTQPSHANAREYRTTIIGIDCIAGQRPHVTLRRELPTSEQGTRLAMRMTSGDAFVLVFNEGRRPDATTELRVQPVAADALARAAASDVIVLREEKDSWMRETRLSTRGLSEALSAAPSRCGGQVG
jgi:hypothetical protein